MAAWVRVLHEGSVWHGWLQEGGILAGAPGLPPSHLLPRHGPRVLAPVVPGKVVGIGSNYRAHAEEMGRALPRVPKIFLKAPSAVVGPGDAIPLPAGSSRVEHEGELAVVIGRTCARVPATVAAVEEVVAGYTIGNDVTARDFQKEDGVFARGKGHDGFCPLGPAIVPLTVQAASDLRVQVWVGGELRQDGRTSDMAFGLVELVAFVSDVMTLHPGDVILTGTPAGVGPLVPGDRVRVAIEGLGELENPVVAR